MKKVAVIQSSYLPWKGYFDIIHDVDEFVFHDDIQYTKQDWRNRNIIKTPNGCKWLTIPVGDQGKTNICDVKIPDKSWQKKHFSTIAQNYSKTPHYKEYKSFLEGVYLDMEWRLLSELNRYIIKEIACNFLGITTIFKDSREYSVPGKKHEKLLNLLKAAKANVYISGPSAKDYIIPADYKLAGIELVWKDYNGYPEYPQIYKPFENFVSVLDLLMNTGDEAPYYIWGWRARK